MNPTASLYIGDPNPDVNPTASLYVGDLNPDVTEAMLYEKFTQAGPVISIRLCRDLVSKRSLGYAFVNFQHHVNAKRALDSMNYDPIRGRRCRIMWSHRDPSLRRTAVGNVFIKHLHHSIDSKALHNTFSVFGNILSCKVATYEDNITSKGFGFVHFDTQESADLAIKKMDLSWLKGRKLYVSNFIPLGESDRERYTRVTVRNFGEDVDYERLVSTFEHLGKIEDALLMKNDTGKCLGFGFVNFKTHDAAAKAVETIDGSLMNGRTIYCSPPQKKDRQLELLCTTIMKPLPRECPSCLPDTSDAI